MDAGLEWESVALVVEALEEGSDAEYTVVDWKRLLMGARRLTIAEGEGRDKEAVGRRTSDDECREELVAATVILGEAWLEVDNDRCTPAAAVIVRGSSNIVQGTRAGAEARAPANLSPSLGIMNAAMVEDVHRSGRADLWVSFVAVVAGRREKKKVTESSRERALFRRVKNRRAEHGPRQKSGNQSRGMDYPIDPSRCIPRKLNENEGIRSAKQAITQLTSIWSSLLTGKGCSVRQNKTPKLLSQTFQGKSWPLF